MKTLIAAVALAIATMVVTPPAHAKPLFASTTTVVGYPFFGPHTPTDLHVILVADVSPLAVGTVTHPTVTFYGDLLVADIHVTYDPSPSRGRVAHSGDTQGGQVERAGLRRGWTLIAAVTAVAATMVVTPPSHAKPLLPSQTTVSGSSFFGFQPGRSDMQVLLDAEVSTPVLSPLGAVTHPTITFEVGLPGSTVTMTEPLVGPCPAHCFASVTFYSPVDCSPTDPGIWVRATYSGETLGPPLNVAISAPSASEVYRMSRCPTYRF